jgi:hypothetical protein
MQPVLGLYVRNQLVWEKRGSRLDQAQGRARGPAKCKAEDVTLRKQRECHCIHAIGHSSADRGFRGRFHLSPSGCQQKGQPRASPSRYRKSPKGNYESGLSKGAIFSLVFPRLLFLSAREHTKAYINPEPLCWIPSSIRATATRAPPVQNTIHPLFAPPSQNVFRKQPESRGVSRSAIR